MHYRFTVRIGNGQLHHILVSQMEPRGAIAKAVGSISEYIPRDPAEAKERIDAILAAAPAETFVGVEQPGYKNREAYIDDGIRRGHGFDRYLWLGPTRIRSERAAGSFAQWRKHVAALSSESSYLAFALMLGLAGPLLLWADLPEGAVFHFVGESSTGKTTAARVAASIGGSPDGLLNWGQSVRRLAETAAAHRDRALILNAAEKAQKAEVKAVLQAITHGLAEGTSKTYSTAVRGTLPDVTSRSPILSNGNRSGAVLAQEAGLAWNEQEVARFISIPVPSREEGGVVDMPSDEAADYPARLIAALEGGLKDHHGRVMGRWLDRVWANRGRVNDLMDDFVAHVEPADAFQRRIARKFGLIYAAGMIAVETDFLPWDRDVPLIATTRLYHRAMSAMQVGCPREALVALRDALLNPEVFPQVGSCQELVLQPENRVAGFHFRRAGEDLIAIRRERLGSVLDGLADVEALIAALEQAGVLDGGHGGRRGQQVRVSIIGRTEGRIEKPRCLVMKAATLDAFLQAAGRGRAGGEDAIVIT
ncbi:DUF927 domain-containing protein [Methylobacterium sp. Leaf89]|uniref:DUF927 domain-containing protein n=1 Tax=Methylobacterium sp. Leaf89 TaxID=1736245 RepID=UPI00138ED443|nr:DUF927 domain-containing protein [Methylobacterium sp. Leaf89]